ncbi:hypothetical protein, partial [Pseudomonas aeruginosa]|uniref:hypothetical protein n=1 Tax=Pseudomonas aeruginosa TaxID=287 RepID=UPI000A8DF4C5
VVRFDNRGYKAYGTDDVMAYWQQAFKIERTVFSIDSVASLNSNKAVGSYAELKLDVEEGNCWLTVSSDDREWLDGTFNSIEQYLSSCKNKNSLVRTPWTPLITYVTGQALILVFSLWLAVKISPRLAVDNPVLVGFIILFFLYLPIWQVLHGQLIRYVGLAFPHIKFHKQSRTLHWFGQAIVGAVVLAGLGQAGSWLLSLLGELIRLNP